MGDHITYLKKYFQNRLPVIYGLYVCLIYVFWFSYAWSRINSFAPALQLFLYASAYLLAFWINVKFLFPRFFLEGKLLFYLLFTCLSFFILGILQRSVYLESLSDISSLYSYKTTFAFIREVAVSQITFGTFTALGISIDLVRRLIRHSEEISELRSEKLKAELMSLKNQLSPHFLFNTLNMLHILTKKKPVLASEVSLELADLMHYQLYGSVKERVALSEEIAFIQNLLRIEKLRKDNLKLAFHIDADKADVKIQPLILVPLVENALKHGSQKMRHAEISLDLSCRSGLLRFRITNNFKQAEVVDDNKGGTGLLNLKRRLELVYASKFTLKTEAKDDRFTAELLILELE